MYLSIKNTSKSQLNIYLLLLFFFTETFPNIYDAHSFQS